MSRPSRSSRRLATKRRESVRALITSSISSTRPKRCKSSSFRTLLQTAPMRSRVRPIVGVNGGIDAMRRSLYTPMTDEQLPDFVLPLQVVRRGYRVVYEPNAILNEDSLSTSSDEYKMRVRVALRAWWTLSEMRAL